jgi:PAS domain S-box-containing protein
MNIKDIRPAADVPALLRNVAQVTAGIDRAGVWRHRHKSGRIASVEITSHVVGFEGRQAELVLARDVTEREQAELALQASEARFRAVFEHGLIAMGVSDAQGRLLDCNPAFERLMGCSRDELLAMTFMDLTLRDDIPASTAQFRRLLRGETSHFQVVNRYVRKDGDVVCCETGVSAIRGKDGAIESTVSTIADISERKRAEDRIRQINDELELMVAERTAELQTLNQQLETFTYSVSHDLKAPLRGIDGYSKLLLEDHGDCLDEEGRAFLQNVRRGVSQMSQLIDDLLAYSRMERRPLRAASIEVRALAESLLAERSEDIGGRAIDIRVVIPFRHLRGDPDGLAQSLRNLIDNAIKFTRETSNPAIEIGGQEGRDTYTLWVRDNGIGFDKRFQDRIFEIFQRLHRPEDYPGTGIGLTIVRKAMQRMGGRAWVQSQPGVGTTVYLELPR